MPQPNVQRTQLIRRRPLAPIALVGLVFGVVAAPWIASHNSPSLGTALPAAALLALGLGIRKLITTRRSTLTIDRDAGMLRIQSLTKTREIALEHIRDSKLELVEQHGNTTVYRLDLILQNGTAIKAGEANRKAAEEAQRLLRAA